MQSRTSSAIFLIAISAFSTWAGAQNTYKCGDTYSQLPCPGSVVVDTADKRTSAQKAQTDSAAARDARTATAMEKTRLEQEKKDLAANTPPLKPDTLPTAVNAGTSKVKKKKKKTPEYFTAQVPGQKKKRTPKKPIEKNDESTS